MSNLNNHCNNMLKINGLYALLLYKTIYRIVKGSNFPGDKETHFKYAK